VGDELLKILSDESSKIAAADSEVAFIDTFSPWF
jgi:hypothetical protein